MSFVITHQEFGTFVGASMGMGFWTALDCAGQECVCAFPTAEDAMEFAKMMDPDRAERGEFSVVEAGAKDSGFVTAQDLAAAGLTEAATSLMLERLANSDEDGLMM